MAKKWKWPYRPGDWLLIPVSGMWFAVRLIRVNIYGTCVGSVFGPLVKQPPHETLVHLRSSNALFCRRFSGLYAETGRWIIVDGSSDWRIEEWPMPAFRYYDDISGNWKRRTYDDETLTGLEDRVVVSEADVAHLSEDGCAGSLYLERQLARLAGQTPEPLDLEKLMHNASTDPPQHYIYFHDGELAEYARKEIEPLGLSVTVRPPVEGIPDWLVLAKHPKSGLSEREIEAMEQKLRPLVESLGGEYDGWDRPGQ